MAENDPSPIRVLIIVKHASQRWATDDAQVIDAALHLVSQVHHRGQEIWTRRGHKLIAKEMWECFNCLVVDVAHDEYNWNTAHLEGENDLPVITVRFSGKKETASIEGAAITTRVNQELRQLHDNEGYDSKPPFFVDHTNGRVPTYPKPRTVLPLDPPC